MAKKQKNDSNIDEKRVFVFYGITFGLGYVLILVLWLSGGLYSETELLPGFTLTGLVTSLYFLLPAVGHLLTRLVTKEGWKHMYLRPNLGGGWKYWVLSWLGIPLLLAVGALVFFLIFPEYFDPELRNVALRALNQGVDLEALENSLTKIVILQAINGIAFSPFINILGSFGGEFGWRGYLQPKLMELGPRTALLITGASWGLYFAPLVALGYTYTYSGSDYVGAPFTGMLMIILANIYMGVVLGWLTYKAKSVWPAVIGYGLIAGVADIALLVSKGTPPLLLGPTVNGVIGGMGFIVASILILRSEKTFQIQTRYRGSWKKPKR